MQSKKINQVVEKKHDWRDLNLLIPVVQDRINELKEWSEGNDGLLEDEVITMQILLNHIEAKLWRTVTK